MTQMSLLQVMRYLASKNLLIATFPDEAPCLKLTIETVEMAGALVIREAFGTRRGLADVLACYNGRFFAFECKSTTGTLSKQQIKFIDKVRAAGGIGVEVRCMADVLQALAPFEGAGNKH